VTPLARTIVLFLPLLGGLGCAARAVRPPTPAAKFDITGLEWPAPGERYYVTVFGSQSTPKVPRHTHTWATVVRVSEREPGQPSILEAHTISWMPATLKIHTFHFQPEPGVNLELHRTVAFVLDDHQQVAQWGPYECRPRFYHRFLVQKQFMESGRVAYQCVDDVGPSSRRGAASDCIHAITDMDPEYDRRHYPLARFGQAASEYIVTQLIERNSTIAPQQVHPWLNDALSLSGYAIEHRD
jgi:hypothetical protein